jgi:predicted GNAT family acetyltransferase
MSEQPTVVNNTSAHRFEIDVEGEMALLDYVERGNDIALVHTEVPTSLEGQGVGSQLVQYALDYARRMGKRVIPSCHFVQAYIKRHPQTDESV